MFRILVFLIGIPELCRGYRGRNFKLERHPAYWDYFLWTQSPGKGADKLITLATVTLNLSTILCMNSITFTAETCFHYCK